MVEARHLRVLLRAARKKEHEQRQAKERRNVFIDFCHASILSIKCISDKYRIIFGIQVRDVVFL